MIKITPKTGLALGGGAARGAAHLGILKALEENNIKIDLLSGTSIGALVAALYSFGVTIEKMRKIAEEMNWLKISKLTLPKLGLLSNEEIADLITDNIGDKKIEEAPIPLLIVATDIITGKKVTIKTGSVAEAVRASTCIPGVYTPVEVSSHLLVDGMLVENVPVFPLKENGADIIIAVNLSAERKNKYPDNIIDVLLSSIDIAINDNVRSDLKIADLVIEPALSKYSVTDTSKAKEIYAEGYRAAVFKIENIKGSLANFEKSGDKHLFKRIKKWFY